MIVSEVVAEGIRVLRIDRPHRRNAIDSVTAEALHDAFVAFDGAGDERGCAVILAPEFATGVTGFTDR